MMKIKCQEGERKKRNNKGHILDVFYGELKVAMRREEKEPSLVKEVLFNGDALS